MNILTIFWIIVAALAAIGFIIGFIKGFTNVRTWANDYLFATLCTLLALKLFNMEGDNRFWLICGFTVGFLIFFMIVSRWTHVFFANGIKKRKLRSFYDHYEEREENDEDILDAIDLKDERTYRKLSGKKFRESSGAIGIFSRICGGITLMIKAVVIAALVASAVLVVIDLIQVSAVGGVDMIQKIYQSSLWALVKKYAFDFYLVGIVLLCIRIGFKGGLLTNLWTLVVIALLIGAGYVSYNFAFHVEAFRPAVEGLSVSLTGKIDEFVQSGNLQAAAEKFGDTSGLALFISRCIFTAVFFIVLLIPVILCAVFVPRLIDFARDGVIFSVIDGILGAAVLLGIVMGLILVLGATFYTLDEFDFMAKFKEYIGDSKIATIVYQDNILNGLDFFTKLPLKDWLSGNGFGETES